MSAKWSMNKLGFLEVDTDRAMIQRAKERDKSFQSKYGSSGTHRTDKSRQRITGYLAEEAIKFVFPELAFSDNDEVDFVYEDKTFDSKAQGCNTPPAMDYDGTVYEEQKKREVNFYIFSRVSNDSKKVWIAGIICKAKFFETAKLLKAGSANMNFRIDQSRYSLPYERMQRPSSLLRKLRKVAA